MAQGSLDFQNCWLRGWEEGLKWGLSAGRYCQGFSLYVIPTALKGSFCCHGVTWTYEQEKKVWNWDEKYFGELQRALVCLYKRTITCLLQKDSVTLKSVSTFWTSLVKGGEPWKWEWGLAEGRGAGPVLVSVCAVVKHPLGVEAATVTEGPRCASHLLGLG